MTPPKVRKEKKALGHTDGNSGRGATEEGTEVAGTGGHETTSTGFIT